MEKKISLVYENGEYTILVNGTIVNKEKDFEKSVDKFNKVINDNKSLNTRSWESILDGLKDLYDEKVEINNEYKALSFESMKYFYNTGKAFYMRNGQMTELSGSYNLFYYSLKMILKGKVKSCEELLEFLTKVLENKAVYTINDTKVRVSSPKFNYGFAEYDYVNDKIDKGTSVESGNFEKFKEYVLERLM
ncbi:hypothetical protein KQI36_13405 [Clostridium senegalense]|uniref:hypothetical protein n=1 Tax=Clostridium senegalense TaxID=1465809 RepID=UPI001C126451|nr:hypothetical protein [Clostridium senegalense]MBU5227629.1 hypothetical protein [Clostridium senegalense]